MKGILGWPLLLKPQVAKIEINVVTTGLRGNYALIQLYQVYREVNPEATLLDHWTTRIERSQTHYVHSIIYGGWSAILYRFRCEIPGDEEVVRQILTSFIGTSGNMGNHTVELLNNAVKKVQESKDLNGKVDIHIHVYSSVPHSEDVTSPESLLKVIEKLLKMSER
ncbi:uncharacterized protein TNCV_1920561 [Trichonephila clavipes]|nr:uncharacterized protein TNCV_1920561 [Trichonephila clavipes]